MPRPTALLFATGLLLATTTAAQALTCIELGDRHPFYEGGGAEAVQPEVSVVVRPPESGDGCMSCGSGATLSIELLNHVPGTGYRVRVVEGIAFCLPGYTRGEFVNARPVVSPVIQPMNQSSSPVLFCEGSVNESLQPFTLEVVAVSSVGDSDPAVARVDDDGCSVAGTRKPLEAPLTQGYLMALLFFAVRRGA